MGKTVERILELKDSNSTGDHYQASQLLRRRYLGSWKLSYQLYENGKIYQSNSLSALNLVHTLIISKLTNVSTRLRLKA